MKELNKNQIDCLKELRKYAGLNQREMTERYGIPLRTWEDWESGRRKMPDYLMRMLQYKVRMDFLHKNHNTENSSISIIYDCDGNRIVLINDLRFKGRLIVRHADDGKLYLYDILRIKKETSKPLEQ